MASRVSVYVGEDHPIYLDGLVRALRQRPAFEVVGSSRDGRAALDGIRELTTDVAILDENMRGMLGSEVLAAITRDTLPTRAAMLSASLDDAVVFPRGRERRAGVSHVGLQARGGGRDHAPRAAAMRRRLAIRSAEAVLRPAPAGRPIGNHGATRHDLVQMRTSTTDGMGRKPGSPRRWSHA